MPRIHNHWSNLSPTSTRNTVDWRQEGNCAGMKNPDAMFPAPTDTDALEAARMICDTCPVKQLCRTYALEERIADGVWGGLSEAERRNIWRNNRPDGCGTETGWHAHHSRNEKVCQPCATAHGRHIAASRRARLEEEHEKGGSEAGAQLHRRLAEKVCWQCLEASARAQRERKNGGPVRAYLTPGQKNAIAKRRLKGTSPSTLALEYGVGVSHITKIVAAYKKANGIITPPPKTGRIHGSSPNPQIATRNREIAQRRINGERPTDLAREYDMDTSAIRRIVRDNKHLTTAA